MAEPEAPLPIGGAAEAGPPLAAEPPAPVAAEGHALDPEAPYVRLAVVAIVREPRRGDWLLIRAPREDEVWGPPGGRVERGESLTEALRRELLEEVGLEVETRGPCFAYVTMHKGERMIGVHMACRTPTARPRVRLAPEEAIDHRWVSTTEWEHMAEVGLTPWERRDVVRVTALASTLLDLEE